jgi:hypothetical protein
VTDEGGVLQTAVQSLEHQGRPVVRERSLPHLPCRSTNRIVGFFEWVVDWVRREASHSDVKPCEMNGLLTWTAKLLKILTLNGE